MNTLINYFFSNFIHQFIFKCFTIHSKNNNKYNINKIFIITQDSVKKNQYILNNKKINR